MDSGTPINGGDAPTLHTLPHNLEAEKAFLGGIFIEAERTILEATAAFLKPEHFAYPQHGRIYEAALRLHERGQPTDTITMRRFFEAGDNLAEIGGPGYLADLTASAVTKTNAKEYAKIIHDLWRRRELIAAGEDLARAAYDAEMVEKTEAILERHEASLAALADHNGADKGGLIPASAIVGPTLDEIERVAAAETTVGLTTGIADLDKFTGGFMPSDLIVVAASTGMGKSSLALTIAKANAEHGRKTGFFSLEMSKEELMMRALAMYTGVSASDMRSGNVSDVQVDDIRSAGQAVVKLTLLIDDRGGVSVSYIRHRAKQMKRKHGLDLLVIDYLGLISPDDRYRGSRANEVSQITAALKALAKELGVPVVLLSQLNREVEKRDKKRPQLSDLKESGSIEQDADVVMFIFREDYYIEQEGEPTLQAGEDAADFVDRHADWIKQRDEARGKADIIIAKQRQGRTGMVKAHFNEERTMFGDLVK